MDTIHVSAPGKLMLLGEHAVVQGRPCLVTAMDARLHMHLMRTRDDMLTIHAPDVGVDHAQRRMLDVFAGGQAIAQGTRFIESTLAVFQEQYHLDGGLSIETHSDFSSRFGLGSSSATVACLVFGLAKLLDLDLEPRRLFEVGLEAVWRVQRTGSGFDLAAAIWGGTLYYQNVEPRIINPLHLPDLPLVVAYSGIKADTPTYVSRVNVLAARWPDMLSRIFDTMGRAASEGRALLEEGEWEAFGQLMDLQHGLLHALGVDTPETARLVFAARQAGAYGAKLSGAGGGDCIIALAAAEQRPAVEAALTAAGGQLLAIAPQAEGVRVEG